MRDYEDVVRVECSMIFPWIPHEIRYVFAVSRIQFENALTPLPRDRELNPFSREETIQQLKRRERLAEIISKNIAYNILDACEKEDTVMGYRKGS